MNQLGRSPQVWICCFTWIDWWWNKISDLWPFTSLWLPAPCSNFTTVSSFWGDFSLSGVDHFDSSGSYTFKCGWTVTFELRVVYLALKLIPQNGTPEDWLLGNWIWLAIYATSWASDVNAVIITLEPYPFSIAATVISHWNWFKFFAKLQLMTEKNDVWCFFYYNIRRHTYFTHLQDLWYCHWYT